MKKIISLFIVVAFFCSCNEYQNALKSEDVAVKFDLATKLYDAGKYNKAIRLFEQIAPSYRGKPQAEKLFFLCFLSRISEQNNTIWQDISLKILFQVTQKAKN